MRFAADASQFVGAVESGCVGWPTFGVCGLVNLAKGGKNLATKNFGGCSPHRGAGGFIGRVEKIARKVQGPVHEFGGLWYNRYHHAMDFSRRWATLGVMVGSALLAGVMSGCEKPLFPPNTARSQYERYSLLRGQYRPAEQENMHGGSEPALRQRLRPLEP